VLLLAEGKADGRIKVHLAPLVSGNLKCSVAEHVSGLAFALVVENRQIRKYEWRRLVGDAKRLGGSH
jgi:hypothetical protein